MRKSHYPNSSGQAVLLVLLSLAVVLTVAVSFLARSVTEVSITTRSEDSFRAFSAAEAGVEKTLLTGLPSDADGESIGEAKFVTTVNTDTAYEIVLPSSLTSGESGMAWFVDHDDAGNITCTGTTTCYDGSAINVCWGEGAPDNDAQTPAAEISIFYDPNNNNEFSDIRVARVAVDPNDSRRGLNFFDPEDSGTCTIVDSNGENVTFNFHKQINLSGPGGLGIPAARNAIQFLKVKLLYNTDPYKAGVEDVGSDDPFPPQGKTITSIGTAGESTRKLNVFESFGEPPSILDNAIYSPYDLVKSN